MNEEILFDHREVIMVFTFFVLLIVFELKHYLADYVWQTKYMLGKFKPGKEYVFPLACHCTVHAIMSLLIIMYVNPSLWWLAITDFTTHFFIDRIKASPHLLGRFKPEAPIFWKILGLDQFMHSIVTNTIILLLVLK